MKCKLVDVFTDTRLAGNGLTIFYDFDNLSPDEMLSWTREMRQFESIFVTVGDRTCSAKIYTNEEELDFAGHPLLGLAYHLHEESGRQDTHEWHVKLNRKTVLLRSSTAGGRFTATMYQGRPAFINTLSGEEASVLYSALNLGNPAKKTYPAEVVSTGLPYVILPVSGGIENACFTVRDITPLLEKHGAKFLYVLDIHSFEGRTWDNCGKVEDVATGSAAGPAAAYLYRHSLTGGDQITIRQGRFVGRPSEIDVQLVCENNEIADVKVSGNVVKVADIALA